MSQSMRDTNTVIDYTLCKIARQQNEALMCLNHMKSAGHFDVELLPLEPAYDNNSLCEVLGIENYLEDEWRHAYNKRRQSWKQCHQILPMQDLGGYYDFAMQPSITDMNVFLGKTTAEPPICEPSILNLSQLHASSSEQICMMNLADVMTNEFHLNDAQCQAFMIIAQHSMTSTAPLLQMFLGGPGGSGKSQVINTVNEYFVQSGQGNRIHLSWVSRPKTLEV